MPYPLEPHPGRKVAPRKRFLRLNFRLLRPPSPAPGWTACAKASARANPEGKRGPASPTGPETGRSAASPSNGNSLSWRIELALLSMVRLAPDPRASRAEKPPRWAADGNHGLAVKPCWCYSTPRDVLCGACPAEAEPDLPAGRGTGVARRMEFGAKRASRLRQFGSPNPGALKCATQPLQCLFWALNSAVECHLHTVEVAGSNPAAPTNS